MVFFRVAYWRLGSQSFWEVFMRCRRSRFWDWRWKWWGECRRGSRVGGGWLNRNDGLIWFFYDITWGQIPGMRIRSFRRCGSRSCCSFLIFCLFVGSLWVNFCRDLRRRFMVWVGVLGWVFDEVVYFFISGRLSRILGQKWYRQVYRGVIQVLVLPPIYSGLIFSILFFIFKARLKNNA